MLIYNPYLNKNIELNDSAYGEYKLLNENNLNRTNQIINKSEGYYPYQSIDMLKKGTVRFAKLSDIEIYNSNLSKFRELTGNIIKNTPLEFNSDIEIHKMNTMNSSDNCTDLNYKFLVQIDTLPIQLHLKNVVKVINYIQSNSYNDEYFFIPYTNDPINDITITKHNLYTKINIVNNNNFKNYLNGLIPDELQRGEFIYELNNIFNSYNNSTEMMELLLNKTVDIESLVDDILEYQRKNIYGFNKNDINAVLKAKHKAFEYYIGEL